VCGYGTLNVLMHGPVNQSGVEVQDLVGAVRDTEGGAQVSHFSSLAAQLLLGIALGCSWLLVDR
jgi:hypothetical protein